MIQTDMVRGRRGGEVEGQEGRVIDTLKTGFYLFNYLCKFLTIYENAEEIRVGMALRV